MKKILSLVDNKLVLSYRYSANQKPHSFIQSIFIEHILWAWCRSWVCCDGMKQFVVAVHSFSHIWLFVTPWTAVHQALPSFTTSWSLLKLTSIESVMPSNHLILCHPLLLLPSIFPRNRVFSNELVLRIRWPKYRSFSLSISPSNE